jgi:hypothetical protein
MKKSFIAHAFVLAGLLLPVAVFAQAATGNPTGNYTFVPLTNLPGLPTVANSASLPSFLNNLYKICIGLAAVLAVLQIMRAGFMFMTNKGSVSGNEAAKSLITQSILGLVLVLSPVIVFGIIDPSILKLNLDASSLQTSTSTWFTTSTDSSSQQQLICKDYTKTAFINIGDGNPGRCAAVEGSGWAAVNCCTSPTPAGGMCCGYSKNNDQGGETSTAESGASGSFSYDYEVKDTNYDDGSACVTSGTKRFTTTAACTTDMNSGVANFVKGGKTYAVSNNCNGVKGSFTPVTSYTAIKDLPECN